MHRRRTIIKINPDLELKIIQCLADGLSAKMISDKLCIYDKHIEYYKVFLLRKYKAVNSNNLVSIAYKQGILTI